MQKFLFRQAANLLQVFQPKLNILIYHRVMPEPDPLRPWEIDANQFRKHLEWISGVYNVIPLSDAIQQLKTGNLKRRSLAITFDDGYLDNASHALPLLKEFGFHATFFCTTAYLDGGLMWNDKVIESIRNWPHSSISIQTLGLHSLPLTSNFERAAAIEAIISKLKYISNNSRFKIANELASKSKPLPRLMMNAAEIRTLHDAGMEIGGHSHSHPILAKLSNDQALFEITKNKEILEKLIGQPVSLFAYPNGRPKIDYLESQIDLLKNAKFSAAVSTRWGASSQQSEAFQLRRFTPWNNNSFFFLASLIRNYFYTS